MKTYLVTGATSGIGKSLVESYKSEDVKIIALGRDQEKLNNLSLEMGNDKVICISADLNDVPSLKNNLANILNLPIDGFIHCAGTSISSNFRKNKYENNIQLMNINFLSFVEILKLLVLHKEPTRRFRVVAMSSVASIRNASNDHMYAATKGALDSFVRSVSEELIKKNVEINTLQPGFVNTPMLDGIKDVYGDDFNNLVKRYQPLGIIEVEDIIEQIRFLLEKKSTMVTGTSLYINAGRI